MVIVKVSQNYMCVEYISKLLPFVTASLKPNIMGCRFTDETIFENIFILYVHDQITYRSHCLHRAVVFPRNIIKLMIT